jgi:hypothetical protein
VNTTRHSETIGVITRDQRRRRWSLGEKQALVTRTTSPARASRSWPHDTRRVARSLGRDYESRIDLSYAPTVLAQLAAAFEHFN